MYLFVLFFFFLGNDQFHVLSDEFIEWLFIRKSENQYLLEMILEKGVIGSVFKKSEHKVGW